MQRTIRVLFVLLFTTLGSLVSAEDIGVCKAGCDSAKKRCRSEADLKANAESYPPIQIDDGTINLDRKRDMRAVLEDRQRREDGQKKILKAIIEYESMHNVYVKDYILDRSFIDF